MKKKIVGIIVALVILVLIGLIFNNLFGKSNSPRVKSTDKYTLTNNEKNSVKDKLEEIDNVDKVEIYTNVKIIKIIVNLSDDTDFEKVKSISNEALSGFKEKNLNYYDIEIYVNGKEDSEIYPKIGYKHKTKSEFKW